MAKKFANNITTIPMIASAAVGIACLVIAFIIESAVLGIAGFVLVALCLILRFVNTAIGEKNKKDALAGAKENLRVLYNRQVELGKSPQAVKRQLKEELEERQRSGNMRTVTCEQLVKFVDTEL